MIITAAAAFLWFQIPAQAAMTAWQDLGGGKARLVASLDPADMSIAVVVDVNLKPGWKTYWREPGGAGIPPGFDFSRSEKFLAGEAAFPVPEYLSAGGLTFPGYKERVRFVIDGTARALSADGAVRLDFLIGVCEEICIPATASFVLPFADLMRADPQADMLIRDARAELPEAISDAMEITGLERRDGGMLEVTARLPAASARADLFAEAPAGWYVSPARLESFDDGQAVFSMKAKRAGSHAANDRARFRLTMAADHGAIEQWHDLPPAP